MTETPVTEIVFVDADTYVAIYVNGDLNFWSDSYNADFEYGLKIGAAHPNHKLIFKDVDFDWLYKLGDDMPEKLEDVKFA